MNYTLLFVLIIIIIIIYFQYDNLISFRFSKGAIYLNEYKEQLFNTNWFKYNIKSNTLFSNYYSDKETYQNIKNQSLILKKYKKYI
jgi:ABC-type phosphate/phosphonate transport system permease subunit